MGIKHLNAYLKISSNKKGMSQHLLSYLRGTTVAMDINIYLYKMVSFVIETNTSSVEQQTTELLSIFADNGISVIFVFDNRTIDDNKSNIVSIRRRVKQEAKHQYEELINTNLCQSSDEYYQELYNLRNTFTQVFDSHIEECKRAINACDKNKFFIVDAPCEADTICVNLVRNGYNGRNVWGCISEDTDLLLMNCPNVIRNFTTESITIYNMHIILKTIGLTISQLRLICAIAGTDYTVDKNDTSYYTINAPYTNKNNKFHINDTKLFQVAKLFREYQHIKPKTTINFITWLQQIHPMYENLSIEKIAHAVRLYDIK